MDWLGDQADQDLFVATLTIAEIRKGILLKAPGKKRQELEEWFSGDEGPEALFAGRILTFDTEAALIWAELMSEGQKIGRQRSPLDMIISAIAIANSCVVATNNEKDFWGIPFFNPIITKE